MPVRLHIAEWEPIERLLGADPLRLHLPEEHFAPRDAVDAPAALWGVYADSRRARLAPVEWALVPVWARPGQFPKPLTVARIETVWERASFKHLIPRYRALLPVNGFFTWTKDVVPRRAWLVKRADGEALTVGAVRQWNGDGNLQVCVLTRPGQSTPPHVARRRPVIIPPERRGDWLHAEGRKSVDAILAADGARGGADWMATEVDPALAIPRGGAAR